MSDPRFGLSELFADDAVIGVFRGFQEGGLEFHADLALPYRSEFQQRPMHGQFILVQLESRREAVLGRITSFSSEGRLAQGQGEEFTIRAAQEKRDVPEDLRTRYLKYRINIRVLGVVRLDSNGNPTFVASHRRLPHVGSPVAFPDGILLQWLAGHLPEEGAVIGHFTLGEFVYAQGDASFKSQDWMQIQSPLVKVRFPVESLVARRSFIFARAGFGKSNLNKLLFAELYGRGMPHVTKRQDRQVPVGTVIFDPDGEYFWPDDKGRPGLCDVPELEDKLVVFTSRQGPSPFYQSFVAGHIRLDIRRLRPTDVIAIAVSSDRQQQQNVAKLRALPPHLWERLVDLIYRERHAADLEDVAEILGMDAARQEAEAIAARSNMMRVVDMLHDPGSQMLDMLMQSLRVGKLCVVDVSQMRGTQSLILAGLILRRIFDHNQEQFTAAEPKTIPTIAVIEEAQSVLADGSITNEPFIAWVKEGRKYDLGAVLITQQPGSIPVDILSQGDNWFVFHLLSSADLIALKRANSHFSDDLLSVLINEPIPGHGVFWSSVAGKPYPISLRAASFEQKVPGRRDPRYDQPGARTYALELRERFGAIAAQTIPLPVESTAIPEQEEKVDAAPDALATIRLKAIKGARENPVFMQKLQSSGQAWGSVKAELLKHIDDGVEGREDLAFRLVRDFCDQCLGHDQWHTAKKPRVKGEGMTTYVMPGAKPVAGD
jgi:hypothetical protein